MSVAVLLRRMTSETNAVVHRFASSEGLHPTDVHALAAVLDADEGMTPTRLRQRLGLTSGAVTACLDRLERAGHIVRTRDTQDRRVVLIHYREPARQAAREHFRPLARATRRALEDFTPRERRTVLRFLTLMNEELAQLGPEPHDPSPVRERRLPAPGESGRPAAK